MRLLLRVVLQTGVFVVAAILPLLPVRWSPVIPLPSPPVHTGLASILDLSGFSGRVGIAYEPQWYTFAAVGAVLLLSYYGGSAAARRLLSGPGRAPAHQPGSSV